MAELVSTFQPGFSLFPRNNNRTGWQPVNIPLVLVVPYVRTESGFPVSNANVCDVAFLIEEAPGRTPVAAPANIGKFVPDYERFRLDIDALQLASVRIDPTALNFTDANGNVKTYADAVDGDLMEYGLLRGPVGAYGQSGPGAIDTIPFLRNADYYDLSPFILETIDLPYGNYNFVYEARYYRRVISPDDEFVCIDDSKKVLSRHVEFIKHPGELHDAMVSNTPGFYFEGQSKDTDSTVAFYRPFADALQDIFDEQELLKGVNWVDKIPAQYVPYLTYLLGFDMPYFNPTTDNIRKALLRNGRKLQQLKGSARAIKELFEIFGFIIDVTNLWYSKDGTRFIGPNEALPAELADQEITTQDVCHAEPLLSAWTDPGFGQVDVPFLFRPLGNITVDAWLVETGSAADIALQSAVNATASDVEAYNTDNCALTIQGFQSSNLQATIPAGGVLGQSTILIDQDLGGIEEAQQGSGNPLNVKSVVYDKDRNAATVTFDRYLSFVDSKLYVFATYERTKIILPPDLTDLKSNRFDIDILLFKDGGVPVVGQSTFDFLLEFLFKFKAFHSLLRKITFPLEITDIYNVTDFCAGGMHAQSPFTDAGQLQVPPAVIPTISTVPGGSEQELLCDEESLRAGAKDADVELRSRILKLLEEEHDAWKSLDSRYDIPDALLPIFQANSRLQIRPKDSAPCEYNQYGQDRVLDSGTRDYDHTTDDREELCSLEGNDQDYCYKGRVGQEIDISRTLLLEEIFRCKPCTLTGGKGEYYMTPLLPNDELAGAGPGTNAANLTELSNFHRSRHDKGYVGIMAFENPQIHYNDRYYLEDVNESINNRYFATQRPSLEVVKDNLFYPGHRFISMANLGTDFTHPSYDFRPWDYLFCLPCPEDVPAGVTVPELNASITIGSDGDEYLTYDSFTLVYYGNGINADIPQMNNHALSDISHNQITHSIWSSNTPGVSFLSTDLTETVYAIDQVNDGLRYPIEALGQVADTICFTEILGPIFQSANRDCDCDSVDDSILGRSLEDILPEPTGITGGEGTEVSATGGVDYLDGYPADFGYYSVDLRDWDFPRENMVGYGFSLYGMDAYGDEAGMADMGPQMALMLPVNEQNVVELQFKVGSGIKLEETDLEYQFYRPYRMDCGASLYECPETVGTGGTGITAGTESTTVQSISRDSRELFAEGSCYDWNCDRVALIPTMVLNDQYGSYTCLMDGSIPNMMSFDDDKMIFDTLLTAFEEAFPTEGNYQFIDDYGLIHVGVFETMNDKLDITTQVRDPRVWGEDPSGEVINYKVFRDGIVTTERQIFQVADFGYTVLSEGVEQEVERFQTTFGCGDLEVFDDPFGFHLDANLVDELDVIATSLLTDVTGTGTGGAVVRQFGFGRGGFGKLSYGGGPSSFT